ncbi:MAG TPA: ATP-dependent DNA helicase RecG [Alphaproteobacteria bacterium]|nr:ATP-dependent DNA helicase RecG [Alphaproteobacteria bacterium]
MSARPHILDNLFLSVKSITGVGPRLSKLLEKLVGPCVVHLLWHLPVDVIDRRYSPPLREAKGGTVATVQVTVLEHIEPKRRGLPYRIKCGDGTGVLDLTFFNARGDYLQNQLPVGTQRVISGKLEFYNGYLQMPHPDFIVAPIDRGQIPDIEPIYPMTAGITHKLIYKFIRGALLRAPELEEWLDSAHQKRENWPSWHDAVTDVHTPQDETGLSPLHPARMRLAYDEMLANQLTLSLLRLRQKKQKGRVIAGDDALFARALESLPFKLTNAQTAAVADIRKDLQSGDRMHRLLQGDVGSGKTAVGFLSMVHAAGSGCQSALMAPTEILARQHEHKLKPLAEKIGLNVVTLTGRDKGKARAAILAQIADGSAHIVIGTHALFQDDVIFHDLGFVIIDEQHRFGVHQRLQLSSKGAHTDVLVMTATPIPRTLTLTVYGDMDVSRLNKKPAGRQPIDTRLVSNERIDEVIGSIGRKIAAGERVYWVCPLVEESEKLDLAAAEERFRHIQQHYGERTGLLHGRMKPADKDAVMEKFAAGDLDVLVSTTVIEVGVDVPEATVMIIEHAERFGLAQLHQLRGRIGRGSEKSTCLLLYNGNKCSEVAKQRLATIRDSEDGFYISEQDLKLRGAGEMLGTRQSGLPAFRLTSPEHHGDLIATAHDDARLILERDPDLLSPRGKALRTLLYLFERDTAIKYLRSG